MTARLEQLGAHVVPGGQAGEGRRAALTAAGPRAARLFLLRFRPLAALGAVLAGRAGRAAGARGAARRRQAHLALVRLPGSHGARVRHPPSRPAATGNGDQSRRCRRRPGAPSTRWPGRPGSPRKRRRSSSPARVSQRPRPISSGPRSSCATIPADSAVCAARGSSGRHPIFTPTRSSPPADLAAWTRATFDTPTMWAARLRLAAASGAALERVLIQNVPR